VNGIAALAAAALIVLVVETDGAVQREFSDELRRGVRDSELWAAARRVGWRRDSPLQRFAEADMGVWQKFSGTALRWFWPVLGIGPRGRSRERGVGAEYFHVWRRVGRREPRACAARDARDRRGFASVVAGLAGVTMLGGFVHAQNQPERCDDEGRAPTPRSLFPTGPHSREQHRHQDCERERRHPRRAPVRAHPRRSRTHAPGTLTPVANGSRSITTSSTIAGG